MPSRISLTSDQERLVLQAITAWSLRDRSLIELGLRTGFRASELSSLTVGQVWDGASVAGELTVYRRNLKGGRGVRRRAVRSRTVPLGNSPRAILGEYLHSRLSQQEGPIPPSEPRFKSAKSSVIGLTPWSINYLVKRACGLAGLPSNGRYGSHSLRKSYCSRIYQATHHDICLTMRAMGHSRVTTTQHYLSVSDDEVRSAILAIQGD
jgi:integrase